MNAHTLRLHEGPFQKIKNGNKTIESRLNDTKRQQFKRGDSLHFVSRLSGGIINTTITQIHHFPTFVDLFFHLPLSKFGEESPESLLTEIEQFYSLDEQKVSGVVGIEFRNI